MESWADTGYSTTCKTPSPSSKSHGSQLKELGLEWAPTASRCRQTSPGSSYRENLHRHFHKAMQERDCRGTLNIAIKQAILHELDWRN